MINSNYISKVAAFLRTTNVQISNIKKLYEKFNEKIEILKNLQDNIKKEMDFTSEIEIYLDKKSKNN